MEAVSKLEARGLRVAVGSRVLVDGLDLEVGPGELLVILGRNGTGKTMLLHTLAGLRAPAAGAVLLDGRPLADLGRRQVAQRLGLLLQIYEDAFPLRVLDAVLIGRHPHLGFWQWESPVDHAIARKALSAMDLEGMEDRAVATLSGGERRRLAIATLLAQEPAVCLLDEPLNHLDPQHQIAVLEHCAGLARSGRAIAATLHDPNLAARFGTRALLLHGDGRWQCGSIPDVLTAAHLSALFRTPIVQVPAQIGPVFVSGGPAS
jgi:iron complex transport system ATP-binding protein